MTPNIHSPHYLSQPEAKRFCFKLPNLNISKIDRVEVFIDLLEVEYLKAKTSLMNKPANSPCAALTYVLSLSLHLHPPPGCCPFVLKLPPDNLRKITAIYATLTLGSQKEARSLRIRAISLPRRILRTAKKKGTQTPHPPPRSPQRDSAQF